MLTNLVLCYILILLTVADFGSTDKTEEHAATTAVPGDGQSLRQCGLASEGQTEPSPPMDEDSQVDARIVGGQEAKNRVWPWQVSLRKRGRHICGGSLIDPLHVLTVAHWIRDGAATAYQVVLGVHDLSGDNSTAQVVGVQEAFIHPSYSGPPRYSHDAAVLRLASPVQFSNAISPVCLPEQSAIDGQQCVTTGWGDKQDGSDIISRKVLMEVTVPIISQETCRRPSHWGSLIDSSMLCAGDTGKDSCRGDGGGPLVCKGADAKWEIQGIVSWGSRRCGAANKPGVYVRVTAVKDWIQQVIAGGTEARRNDD